MDTNEKIKVVGINIQEKASLIWNVANSLFGAYKPHEYGLVILPMVVIKRFHDCLLPYHDKILETYEKVKHLAVKDGFLRTAAGGLKFYNTSPYTFDKQKADPENIKANFESYINGFSDNVIDILANMGFFTQIERMADAGVLYQVISDFTADNAYMSPDKIQPKRAGGQKDRLSPLDEIIQRINEEFFGEFTDADRVMVDTLYQKMRKYAKTKKAAKTDDRQVYERSIFPSIFDSTAQEAYMENTEAYEQLFLDADKYQAVMRALADRLYRELHDGK